MRRSQRIFAILGIGAALIVSELLAFRSLKASMDKLACSISIVLQRTNSATTIVSSASKLLALSSSERTQESPSGAEKPRPKSSIQSKEETAQLSSAQPSANSVPQASFRVTRISNGKLDDTWWEAFRVVASNGHELRVSNTPFSSVKQSDKQYQVWVKTAAKIFRRVPELDENGKVIGERVLGLFPPVKADSPPDTPPYYSVVWTSGANLWRLSGENLEDVLSLENTLKAEGTSVLWKWALAEQSVRN